MKTFLTNAFAVARLAAIQEFPRGNFYHYGFDKIFPGETLGRVSASAVLAVLINFSPGTCLRSIGCFDQPFRRFIVLLVLVAATAVVATDAADWAPYR